MPARLVRVGLDARHRQHLDAAALDGAGDRRFLRHLAQQRGEAAAEAGRTLAMGNVLAHAAAAGLGRRPISSRASAI